MNRVDVVIPVFNVAPVIGRAIRSVLAQTHRDVQVFVVDDGSSDGSPAEARSIGDLRIRVIEQSNAGQASARNRGARSGSGDWIAFVDADDVVDEHWLETLLEGTEGAGLAACGGRFVQGDHTIVRRPEQLGPEFYSNHIIFLPGLFAVRREVFERAGGYDESLRYSENTELGLRLTAAASELGYNVRAMNDPLITVFQPTSGSSQSYTDSRRLQSARRMLEVHATTLAKTPSHLAAYHAIAANGARAEGDRVAARRDLWRAVSLTPRNWRYWFQLLRVSVPDWSAAPRRDHDPARRLVIHLMASDLPRGGQAETRSVCDGLDRPEEAHQAMTVFRDEVANLRAEHRLEVTPGRLRRWGLDPRGVVRLRAALARENPNCVVAHGSEALKYAILARPRRAKLIYHRIGVATSGAQRGARLQLHRWMARRPSLIIAVSEDAAHDLVAFGADADALTVVPNHRNPHQFHPGAPRSGGEPLSIVFVGSLSRSKRPERFLTLVSMLRESGFTGRSAMIGSGPLYQACQTLADHAGVELLGARHDVAALLASFDVLVLTSVAEGEGMPGVLIEAGMCGLAVVTTDVPGARDVVIDGETGWVVPVEPIEPALAALQRLTADPVMARQLGAAGRVHTVAKFSRDAVIENWRIALKPVTMA